MEEYYLVVTDVGLSLIEQAYNTGTQVNITQMALGDSNGAYVEPDVTFTALVNEFGREDISESIAGENLIDVIVYVSSMHAGQTVREFGLYDDGSNMIVYGAYPESLVPSVASSEYIQLEIEARVNLTNAESVNVTVNPYVPYATETTAGVVIISNKYDGDSDTKVVTEKALKEGLATRYGADNPSPLIAKRLYPENLSIDLLPYVGTSERAEWILPDSAQGAKFATVKIELDADEAIGTDMIVYCHDTTSGGESSPSSKASIQAAIVPNSIMSGCYTCVIPITAQDGNTAKRISIYAGYRGSPVAPVSYKMEIDTIWSNAPWK